MTTESLIAIDKTKLAKHVTDLEEARNEYAKLDCVTPEQEVAWALQLEKVSKLEDELDVEHAELKKPITRDGKTVDSAFAPARKACKAFGDLCRSKLAKAAVRRLEADAQAHLALTQASASGDAEAVQDALAAFSEDKGPEGTFPVISYTFSVALLEAVPSDFRKEVLDEDLVGDHIKACLSANLEPQIPGVKFERVVAIRRTGKGAKNG